MSVACSPVARHARFLAAKSYNTSPRFRSGVNDLNLPSASYSSVKFKTIDDLPGPSQATFLYWLFVKGYADKKHALQVEYRRLYGPIWRSRFGPLDMVNVAHPELIAQVIRQEGRYPIRVDLPHWKEYRDLRGLAYGLNIKALNPKLLKLREVFAFVPEIHQVVTDLLQRLEKLRVRSPDRATVCDLSGEFYKFGFEGISFILFETRLGCLEDEIPLETRRFIAAVGSMLTLSETVLVLPRWTRRVLPFWDNFVRASDDLYGVAHHLIDRRVEELAEMVKRGGQVEGMYLTHLLSHNELPLGEVYTSIAELLLGGVDTTSNTLSWTLYHLARDEAVQERLHREVTSVCPAKQLPTTEDLSRMPYLRAVIKEILRLYPVVPGNARLIAENEVIVDNYHFPKETLFHLCHYATSQDETQFLEPGRFLPERWLRGGPSVSRHHPYSSIPFGVGPRACIGRRVAELEMHLALSRLLQHYLVQPEDNAVTIEPKTRTLMVPSKPINLRFLPRA